MVASEPETTPTFTERPTLQTARLLLRPFSMDDAADVQRLAGDREVARNTMLVPHPYEDGEAERWIGTHQEIFESGQGVMFAIERREDHTFMGSIGLTLFEKHRSGELGYWLGRPFWNNGYTTEAARAVLRYGFQQRNLHRIHAKHYTRNPASGRVMQKLGMQSEGVMREHILKWGEFEDVTLYGILAREFSAE